MEMHAEKETPDLKWPYRSVKLLLSVKILWDGSPEGEILSCGENVIGTYMPWAFCMFLFILIKQNALIRLFSLT